MNVQEAIKQLTMRFHLGRLGWPICPPCWTKEDVESIRVILAERARLVALYREARNQNRPREKYDAETERKLAGDGR